jgi:hypothetical protein
MHEVVSPISITVWVILYVNRLTLSTVIKPVAAKPKWTLKDNISRKKL